MTKQIFGTSGDDVLFGSDPFTFVSAGDDQIYGNGGHDLLFGLGGDDYLSGGADADYLDGGAGNDVLDGGAGGDVLVGGVGVDAVSYYGSPGGVLVSLHGNFAYYSDAEGDKLSGVENLWGSKYDDYLAGDDNYNFIWGWEGNDTLVGYGGNDHLIGDNGQDVLYGGTGIDTLAGGAGNDWLNGGMDTDWLYGGQGADTFAWGEKDIVSWGMDYVMDFNLAEGDVLALSAIDADVFMAGDQPFKFIGTAAFSGTPGEIRYTHDVIDTNITIQTDADLASEFIIRLHGIHTPDASWFAL
jgi:serralysin